MGSIPVAKSSPPHRLTLSRRAIAVTAMAAAFGLLAVVALFAWPTGSNEVVRPPQWVGVGQVEDFAPGSVTTFQEAEFHLVRLPDGEFLALSSKDPHLGCTVPWKPEFQTMGQKGWFRNPCHGETYDLAGRHIFGPGPRGLDRFPVTVVGGAVRVNVNELILGPPARSGVEPVNPP